jgi:hypothetical protein
MLNKIVRALVAGACFAVAAGVALVAASYALFALLRDPLGPSGAAAVVAAVAAVLVLAAGLLVGGRSKPHPAETAEAGGHESMAARLLEIGRGHPILAVGAALAGLYVVAKRPGLLALLAANLMGMQRQKQRDRR